METHLPGVPSNTSVLKNTLSSFMRPTYISIDIEENLSFQTTTTASSLSQHGIVDYLFMHQPSESDQLIVHTGQTQEVGQKAPRTKKGA